MPHKHTHPARPGRASLTHACLTLAVLAAPVARAGDATIQAGNSPLSTNITGDGAPLHAGFTFQIGAFDGGLAPNPFNALEWLDHWYPLTDAQGNALPEATVAYDDSELGPPFDPGTRANQFSINVTLTHNLFPFSSGAPVYLWGYDRRQGGGIVEWILITNPGWTWPVIVPGSEPVFRAYDVSHPDTYAIVGQVNSDGIEMRTNTITLSTPLTGYEAWRAEHFSVAELENPALEATLWGFGADADGDAIPNAIEFISGTIPTNAVSRPVPAIARAGNVLKLTFERRKDPGNIIAVAQWSTNLMQWNDAGVTETVVQDLGDRERIEAAVTVQPGRRVFMRLLAAVQDGAG